MLRVFFGYNTRQAFDPTGFFGVFVAIFDKQPVFFIHFDKRPNAFKALSEKLKFERAFFESFVKAFNRSKGSSIPNDDRACSIFALWNVSLKIGVFQRMIFHMNRKPLVFGIERRTFWNRPAEQNSIVFQPKIKVIAPCFVILHDEAFVFRFFYPALRL